MEISRCVWQQVQVLGGVRRRVRVGAIEYSDKGHMRYYGNKKYDHECCLKVEVKKEKKKKKIGEEEEEGVFRRKHKVKSLSEQKKTKKQGKRVMAEDDSSSSSSSSSSSDEDCRDTKTTTATGDESAAALALLRMPLLPSEPELEASSSSPMAITAAVCMGNKCRKMGAESLMAELQQSTATATTVLPCKCMGKCKSAPNVKLLRVGHDDDDDAALFTNVNLNNLSSILHHR